MSVQADHVVASCWMDRKMVTVMSVGYDPTQITLFFGPKEMAHDNQYPAPLHVPNTTNTWGGVDLLRGYYHVRMKCRKFYKYIANF